VGISTWKIAGKSRVLGGFSGTSDDRMFLVFKDGQSKGLLFDEVPRRTRQGAGKSVLSRKEKGVLEWVVPVRMKKEAPKKRKAPSRGAIPAGKRATKKTAARVGKKKKRGKKK
jgi:hypothetical protein